jgi:LPS-assembly lipoprotein
MHRRTWLGQARALLLGGPLVGTLVGPLAGCGFALRQNPALPFSRLHLEGFAERSPLALELRERLADGPVQLVPARAQAEVVLQALVDRREKRVVASTSVGQVRELQLRLRFGFQATTPGGRELIPATELVLQRDLSYSESFALAKAQEEAELYAAMQTDIVQQVLRRLARASLRG